MKKKLGIYIGRFQPFHKGHLKTVETILQHCEKCLIVLGSHLQFCSGYNPWTSNERMNLITAAVGAEHANDILFFPISDTIYLEDNWKMQIIRGVFQHCTDDDSILLYGHNKDESSYYLKLFPQWNLVEIDNFENYNSTDFRRAYFSNETQQAIYDMIPQANHAALAQWRTKELFDDIKKVFFEAADQPAQTSKNLLFVKQYGYVLLQELSVYKSVILLSLPCKSGELLEALENLSAEKQGKENFKYEKRFPGRESTVTVEEYCIPSFNVKLLPEKMCWICLDELFLNRSRLIEDHYQIISYLN